jgi:DNA repair exonuclease SbcCD ATPase subunit
VASLFFEDKVGEEQEFVIPAGMSEVKIGRSAGNELRIRAPSISRNHASVLLQNGQTFLIDHGSSNGTYVNGKRIPAERPVPVTPGDALKFGEVPVRLVEAAGVVDKSTLPFGTPAAATAPPLPGPGASPWAPPPPAGPPLAAAPPAPPLPPVPPVAARVEPCPTHSPRPKQLDGGLDLSHMLNQPAAPPAAAPPRDPLAGLFDNLSLGQPSAKAAPAPDPLAAMPRPGEGPLEISLDDLLAGAPEGQILEEDAPQLVPAPDVAALQDRLFSLDAAPLGGAAPVPAGEGAGMAKSPPAGLPAPDAFDRTDFTAARADEPPPLPPSAAEGAAPALLQRLVELEAELESRRAKVDSLQKAARRDVEAKGKLQEEKTDLELQLTALRAEREAQVKGLHLELQTAVAAREEAQRLAAQQQLELAQLRQNQAGAVPGAMVGAAELQRLQARVGELEELLAETTNESERLARTVEQLRQERDQLQRQGLGPDAAGQLAALRAELDEATSERDSLISRVEELELARRSGSVAEGQVAQLQQELESLRDTTARRSAEYMGHIDMILAEKTALEAALTSAQASAQGLTGELTGVRAELAQLQATLATLPDPAEVAEQEQELAALRRLSDLAEERSRQQEEELSQAAAKLEEFKAKARDSFQDLAAEIGGLEEELEQVQTALQAAQATGAADRAELDAAQRAARQERQLLQEQLAERDAELEELRQAQDELVAKAQQIHQKNKDLQRKAEESAGQLADLEQQLAARPSEQRLTELEEARLLLERQVASLEEELTRLELELRESTKAQRRAQTELEELRTERDGLEGQLAELRPLADELKALRAQHRQLAAELAARPGGEEVGAVRQQLAEAEEHQADLTAQLERLQTKLSSREEELAELRSTSAVAQEGLGAEVARLKELEIALTEEGDRLRAELAALREQASTPAGPDPAELTALQEQLAAAQAEVASLQAAAASSGEAAVGGEDASQVVTLLGEINDIVSGWRNSFMQVGNYLLDLQNGLDTLRSADSADARQGAVADIEKAGNIEEMQELLRACEDDARRLKREMVKYRDLGRA